jgi:[ribosomal protein S5]-alanine N-acetyltransferase
MNDPGEGTPLRTDRLTLVPATCAILAADLEDRTALARLLSARIPAAWPPPLMDGNVLRDFLRMRTDTTGPLFSLWYWVYNGPGPDGRVLAGSGGIVQSGTDTDTVVLGYSVLDEFQNRGYATEAVRALVSEIFLQPGIRTIAATTFPHLASSIRVLEKCGFTKTGNVPSGTGAEEGTVCYLRTK